ncbi:hypothetical protein J7E95_41105 [Streptomyces sp. ISL-14]|nr:hypothetical protein [Streptomyces sp. ISL-14]
MPREATGGSVRVWFPARKALVHRCSRAHRPACERGACAHVLRRPLGLRLRPDLSFGP